MQTPDRTRRLVPMPWALVALLLLGLLLRLPGYTTNPNPRDNRDDLEWAWLGQSLILDHAPSSWSWAPVYPDPQFIELRDGGTAPYVHHWLDNPPVFGLVVGGAAILAGETTPTAVTPGAIRWIPLALSLVSLALLYLLAFRMIGRWAVLAALLFAMSPWNIQISHLVEAETLLAPLLLGALLLIPQRRRLSLAALLVVCAIAPTVKLAGIAIPATAALLLFTGRRWLAGLAAGVAGVAGVAAYLAYGFAFGGGLFPQILHYNASRHASLIRSGVEFLGSLKAGLAPLIPLHDPFWFAGLAAVACTALFWRDARFVPLVAAVIVYTVVMAGVGPDATGELSRNGWYRITIYPLLFIAIAAVVAALCEWGGVTAAARPLLAGAPFLRLAKREHHLGAEDGPCGRESASA